MHKRCSLDHMSRSYPNRQTKARPAYEYMPLSVLQTFAEAAQTLRSDKELRIKGTKKYKVITFRVVTKRSEPQHGWRTMLVISGWFALDKGEEHGTLVA